MSLVLQSRWARPGAEAQSDPHGQQTSTSPVPNCRAPDCSLAQATGSPAPRVSPADRGCLSERPGLPGVAL